MKTLFTVSLFLLSFAFIGCGRNLTDIAHGMQSALGIPVQLNSNNNDSCLYNQLVRLHQEFRELPSSRQQELRRSAQSHYRRIILNRSEVSQIIMGQITTLSAIKRTFYSVGAYNNFRNEILATKILEDHRLYEGTPPLTQVQVLIGESLALTTQTRRDESLRRYYWTLNLSMYDLADNLISSAFITGRQTGDIWLREEIYTPSTSCGNTIALSDILNQEQHFFRQHL